MAASSHSERPPAGTPVPGSQSPAIARRDRHFETTYLTPTEGSQDAEGLESWGSLHSKALIEAEKSREESKSSAAGERKELMLKTKSLLSIFGQFGFLGDAYSWE